MEDLLNMGNLSSGLIRPRNCKSHSAALQIVTTLRVASSMVALAAASQTLTASRLSSLVATSWRLSMNANQRRINLSSRAGRHDHWGFRAVEIFEGQPSRALSVFVPHSFSD